MTKPIMRLAPTESELARLGNMSIEELKAALADSLGLTAQHLRQAAMYWTELEGRGEDMSALRSGLVVYLPGIASGTIAPEAVIAFAGRPSLLRRIVELPPAEQKRLADGGTIPVAEKVGEEFTHRMRPVTFLVATPRLIPQVFGDRCIRSVNEQVSLLSAPPPLYKPGKPIRRGKVVVDRGAGEVRIGKAVVSLKELTDALKAAGVSL